MADDITGMHAYNKQNIIVHWCGHYYSYCYLVIFIVIVLVVNGLTDPIKQSQKIYKGVRQSALVLTMKHETHMLNT